MTLIIASFNTGKAKLFHRAVLQAVNRQGRFGCGEEAAPT